MMTYDESCVVHIQAITTWHLEFVLAKNWKHWKLTRHQIPETVRVKDGENMWKLRESGFEVPARIWHNKLGSGDCQATAE